MSFVFKDQKEGRPDPNNLTSRLELNGKISFNTNKRFLPQILMVSFLSPVYKYSCSCIVIPQGSISIKGLLLGSSKNLSDLGLTLSL